MQKPHDPNTFDDRLAAVILAAGKGTRMGSDLPKVAHVVAGEPMVRWVVHATRQAGASRIILVVGYGAEIVRNLFSHDEADTIDFAVQSEQLGTGHATQVAMPVLDDFEGDVLVLAGDGPLIRATTLRTLVDQHRAVAASVTLATSVIDDPTGYGRIVRDADGHFDAIVEHKNADDAIRRIQEINPSYYCFRKSSLVEGLKRVERNPASGEYYLTDVPGILNKRGEHVEVIDAVPPEDVLSINTPHQLAEVERILNDRTEVPS